MNLRSVNIFRPIGRTYEPAKMAWNTTVDALKPLFVRADCDGLFFRNRLSGKVFTMKELATHIQHRRFVQGPSYWWLVDAQGRRVA